METRAVLLPRQSNSLNSGFQAYLEFCRILDLYEGCIYTGKLLAFLVSIQIVHFVDGYISHGLRHICTIEGHTGHDPRNSLR
jgi:hypothetical protein